MKYFLFTLLSLLPMTLFAQNEPYAKEWQKADSLQQRGMPESAAKIAEKIFAKAKRNGEQVQMMKAQIFLIGTTFERSEEDWKTAILECNTHSKETSFPEKAIWESITAQLYWEYYQQNRWQILTRTKLQTKEPNPDFELWDAYQFYQTIGALYQSSIAAAQELEQINIKQYAPLLHTAINTASYRPTLYDLLAFRALSFFENDEKDLTKPAFVFTLKDKKSFAPATEFSALSFETKDVNSLQKKALEIYQRLLQVHRDDENKDAFLDADLQRLAFVFNHNTHPNKKTFYIDALNQFANTSAKHPLAALALVRVQQMKLEEGDKANKVEIKNELERIIKQYPSSEGETIAQNMLSEQLNKSLQLTAEEVVLPSAPIKILATYKNIPTVYMRIVRINEAWLDKRNDYEQVKKRVLSLKPIYQEKIILPATKDLNNHSTEIKINALETGNYAVLLSANEQFNLENNIVQYASFQVSNLSVVQAGERGYVLNRKTGLPIAGATVSMYKNEYDYNKQKNITTLLHTTQSAKDGRFDMTLNQVYGYTMKVVFEHDSLTTNQYYNGNTTAHTNNQRQTFFFTDRSIYRPGQTVFFKGIIVQQENNGRKNNVITNEKTEVIFYDVNNTKIASTKFTTNEFGSFTGSFIAPQGLLTGMMHISNDNGAAYFSVEEYKRPKFFVAIDTSKNAYTLNDKITVSGKANAYAGNAIDGAKVKYRVVRQASFPYWWYAYRCGFPQSEQMEIANGETATDKEGKFQFDFNAIPDERVNPESMPIFNYSIVADVVDINGETRTGNAVVNIGYTSLQLLAIIPEKMKAKEIDNLNITTKNLNNAFVATTIQLKISKLLHPEKPLKKRMWEVPDQFLMDSVQFKKYFPNDAYKNEDDKTIWEIASTVYHQSLQTKEDGTIPTLSSFIKTSGWYVFELSLKDSKGKELIEKKYAELFVDGQNITASHIALLTDKTNLQPNEKAKITFLSAYDHLHVLQLIDDESLETTWNQINYTGKANTWEQKITEQQRGGVFVKYATVKENRFYTEEVYLNIPWRNKELDINWETHRDKLQPGEKEKWTMVVRGSHKEKVAAELAATLYDASLDALKPHIWSVSNLYPSFFSHRVWNGINFGQTYGIGLAYIKQPDYKTYQKEYASLKMPLFSNRMELQYAVMDGIAEGATLNKAKAAPMQMKGARAESADASFKPKSSNIEESTTEEKKKLESDNIQPRKNLQETAFFFPQLHTDAEGNIRLEFTLPEALTEWKLMTFAHTKDMSIGTMEGKIKTQKDLMVVPNLPRFLRQGDDITITSKINNLSDKELSGKATLEILNAATLQPMNLPFRLQQQEQNISIAQKQSTTASWVIHVPESLYEPVVMRISAQAGNFTDGEETTIPVVTNRMLVTETLPIWMNGDGTKSYSFDKLKTAANSTTLSNHALTVEYSSNPAWLAVQALPYLMEYPYECAEQTFNRYYATALAAHIIGQSPKIKAVFDQWKNETTASSLTSSLAKNETLKSALLEETPWVLEAKDETEQRKNIAQLFDTYKLAKELKSAQHKLKELQLPSGAFGWFKGMYEDRYITQYIVAGIGRLQQLGVTSTLNGVQDDIVNKALPYLDGVMKLQYDELIRSKVKMTEQHIFQNEAMYLYLRSFFDDEMPYKKVYDYYLKQATQFWPSFNPYTKGMLAIALHRNEDVANAKDIIQSLSETAIHKEEVGMYWKNNQDYWWYNAPIETQALLIEAFKEVAKDNNAVEEMKLWLLKNKQTNHWQTTKATADACYALLLSGTDWLTATPEVTITVGNKTINNGQHKQSGTGYFQERIDREHIKPEMGNITLKVVSASNKTTQNIQPSWGAIYWQYFEDLDKITDEEKQIGVAISKKLFIENNTETGKELAALKNPKIGDRIICRIVINVDRDMDYVHLKDMRAACFEPVNVLSGYKWANSLGYYESTKDVSTNFFFDHLKKGKYVFEYPMLVNQKGTFSNGIATIQCMYAPEFSNHTAGETITIP